MKEVGLKNDFQDGKLRWDLLPLEEIEDIVKVYTAGAKKYSDNSWQNLDNGYQRYKAAMLRHLVEYEKGNKLDEDTGCQHLAQVAWNALLYLGLTNMKKVKQKTNKNMNMIPGQTMPLACSGKFIDYDNKNYFLIPEKSQRGCQGCDLLGKMCTKDVTNYCRQGFILKEVKR